MSFNFINSGGSAKTSNLCLYDSNIGYEADFSVDGEVDGWTLYDGIHTYGCWNGFLFGTLYGDTSLVGRHYNFKEVATEDFYIIKLVMKVNIKERVGTQMVPKYGRLSWITVADPGWDTDKSIDFDLDMGDDWYTYYINMGEIPKWQGDVFNLRINPILQDGKNGDEFFIRKIEILSVTKYKCKNGECEYYLNYQHPCPGIGKRGTCASKCIDYLVREGSTFVSTINKLYTIEEGVNDVIVVNINGYGGESIKIPAVTNLTGNEIAYILMKELSKISVGGYSEVEVEYNSIGQFVIYSGTYVNDSVVTVENSPAAITLNFYDENGNYQSTESIGECPVSGYRPFSSFKISTNKVLCLFDNNDKSDFLFNPFIYNIEGGRRDWLDSGLGVPIIDIHGDKADSTRLMNRSYDYINNAGKTIIDFNHPFNASGRINKIYAAITLDNYEDKYTSRGIYDGGRINTQLIGALIMFFRPLKDGTIKVLDMEVPIENRDHVSGKLYSAIQENVELDCDVFVNKGDLIGVYNANIYKGKSVGAGETDALFYQISGKAEGVLNVNIPSGEGNAGLPLYARSDQLQKRLLIDIDLSRRVNIEGVTVIGNVINKKLEYNIARCLDVNWEVDLFGGDHTTGWVKSYSPYIEGFFNHPNIFYGKECLADGMKIVSDGVAAKSFSVNLQTYHTHPPTDINLFSGKDGGVGVIVNDPQYFHVNGDSEWLYSYLLAWANEPFVVDNFKHDPIAFTLKCPAGQKQMLSKLRVYFKERFNFRSFALSFFKGPYCVDGTADIPTYDLIPNRTDGFNTPWSKIILDGMDCVPENEESWGDLELYLGTNPIIGHEIIEVQSITSVEYEHYRAYFSPYGGLSYTANCEVINNEQNRQALNIDWTTLTIEWPSSEELGFRLYCDYHESTKICEMELFCSVSNVGSLIGGFVAVTYSEYGESVWLSEIIQKADDCAYAFIEDTPRYITVEIAPINEIRLKEICISISSGDVFLGEKGCQQQVFPVKAKTNTISESFPIFFKNVYGDSYDLHVGIEAPIGVDNGLIYYSKMNNEESILNPEVGPDSYYKKELNYEIRNDNYNVAINCPVYGLKNLIDGAVAWYSYNKGVSWHSFGILSGDVNVELSNISDGGFSIINLPTLSRNRYWKIGWLAEDHISINVREMKVFYEDEKVACEFYHDKGLNLENGPILDTAPHLDNEIITGSYYTLKYDQYIGFDLLNVGVIDKIILFHTLLSTHCGSTCGIDKYTSLCLQGKGEHLSKDIVDYSYHEHTVEVIGDVCSYKSSVSGDLFEGGVASSSFYLSPYEPAWAVDNNMTYRDEWPHYPSLWISYVVPGWWKYDFGENMEVIGNRLIVRSSKFNLLRDFSIQGSNNDVDWVTFPTASGLYVTDDFTFNLFDFPNTTSYRYYRVYIEGGFTRIYEFELLYQELDTITKIPFMECSNNYISFAGTENDYLKIPYSKYLFVDGSECIIPEFMYFSMDFWMGFRSHPIGKIDLMKGTFWLTLEDKGNDQIEIKVLGASATACFPLGVCRHVYITGRTTYNDTGIGTEGYGRCYIYIDGKVLGGYDIWLPEVPIWGVDGSDLLIGQQFDGWLAEIRYVIGESPAIDSYYKFAKQYERYYTMSIYSSIDNFTYSKYCDVDLLFENSYSYYFPDNDFSGYSAVYLAIDLGHSYALDIIRSFPVDEACQFDLYSNVVYSKIDTADPNEAFKPLNVEDVNTDFSGGNKTIPKYWNASGGSKNYIINDKLYQSVKSGCANLTAEFYLVNNFDLEIEYELINNLNINSWFCGLQIQDINNSDNVVKVGRVFHYSQNRYHLRVREGSSDWSTISSSTTVHKKGSIRFVRSNQKFILYVKGLDGGDSEEYTIIGFYEMDNTFSDEVIFSIITQSDEPFYPLISVEWDNLIFNFVEPIYSSYNDTRWVRIKALSGDGITRTIKRIGIYPNISVQLSKDGNYNTDWIALGESVTSYVGEENVAAGADVEASSHVGNMLPENAVNGVLTFDLKEAWGAEEGTSQWITVTLPMEMQIYKVVVHLNYDGRDVDYLIQDYQVQISIDNEVFNTVFDISENMDYVRTHDLMEPVVAKYVRIYITKYKARIEYIAFSGAHEYWAGATIRQIEIYEYYGFKIIDSETYPIIAIDLRQNYFIIGHSIVGVNPDKTYTDWDNSDSNYAYSNSDLTEPHKVSFKYWGEQPNYEKWAVIKRNTATHYPTVPTNPPPPENEFTDTNDFLKHLIIKGTIDEDYSKPNPVECHWMWNSNISILEYSYDHIRSNYIQRSLKIRYPESSQSDHVYFREGDDFGIDETFSWRDGLGFHWYIDDINNLDMNYGYIYFGGYDSTDAHESVIYKWYLPTLSGILHSGWNDLALTMKAADEIEWTESTDLAEPDPRIVHLLTLQKLGMVFKGKGKALTMYIDGFIIEQNHFKDMNYFDRGLYIHNNELLKANVEEVSFTSGTLEFFIRPDWKLSGCDVYNEFKFRSLFHFCNVVNDVFGAGISADGLEVYYGNILSSLTIFVITELSFDIIDKPLHMAFVFSNNGTGISNDGSTVRVYFNNTLIGKSTIPWYISDHKHFNFVLGGESLLIQKAQGKVADSSSIDGVVSNLKIYNYCKTDFSDSMGTSEISNRIILTRPSELIEISKDNLTFYNVDDSKLPFCFKKVPQNEIVPIYVRTIIPEGLCGKEIRTTNILGQWDIGV